MTKPDELDTTIVDSVERLMGASQVAVVGASEKSMFLRHLFGSIDGAVDGMEASAIHVVNPRAEGTVFGRTALPTIADLPSEVDLAFLALGAPRVAQAIPELAAHGIRQAVVLSGGYAEEGTVEGVRLQRELVELARAHGVVLLGPNTLGFVNTVTGLTAMATRLPPRLPRGDIAIVSQSGAVGSTLVNFAAQDQIGTSWAVSTGNEAMVTAGDVIAYATRDDHTRVIALYLESVRQPRAFLEAVDLANTAGKTVIACKVGRGEAAARVAAAHTGGVAGDDDVVEAVFRQHGIVRTHSAEELVYTASAASVTGGRVGRRTAFVSLSGGFCTQAADLGDRAGLTFPQLGEGTVAAVRAVPEAPERIYNPLDTTGTATTRVAALSEIAAAVSADEQVETLLLGVPVPHTPEALENHLTHIVAETAERLAANVVPTYFVENVGARTSEIAANYFADHKARYLSGGLAHVTRALGRLANRTEWAAARSTPVETAATIAALDVDPGPENWDEPRTRDFLDRCGVRMVPGEHVGDVEAAVEAACRLGYPVVLKAVGADLQHKSDIGGVRLDIRDEQQLRAEHAALVRSVEAAAGKAPDGVLVSPMRGRGLELIVGVVADPTWGHVLAVGLGGVWTEIMRDVSLRVLPVSAGDVEEMLGELRGAALLDGYRGSQAVDRAELVRQILAITGAVASAPRDVLSLEVNPMLARGTEIEALDALVEWAP